jgi:integrase
VLLPKDGRRDRVLSRAETAALAKALDLTTTLTVKDIVAKLTGKKPDPRDFTNHHVNPYAVAQVRMILATGARREEVQAMRWVDLDLDNGIWRITDDKGYGGARPLSRPALALLEGLERRVECLWVFPCTDGKQFYTGLPGVWDAYIKPLAKLAAKEAGGSFGDDVGLHTIRHTFATLGALQGSSTALLQAALGHRSPSTTMRYQHVHVAPAQLAADRIAAQLSGREN